MPRSRSGRTTGSNAQPEPTHKRRSQADDSVSSIPNGPFNALPRNLCSYVLRFFPLPDFDKVATVNKTWRDSTKEYRDRWQKHRDDEIAYQRLGRDLKIGREDLPRLENPGSVYL